MKPSKFRRQLIKHLPWFTSLSLTITALALVFLSPIFKIKHLFCQVDTNPCPEAVLAEFSQLQGSNIFLVKTSLLKDKLQRANKSYHSVRISTQLPDSVRLEIDTRPPFAQLKTATNSASFIVDSEGIILGQANTTSDLPIINVQVANSDLTLSAIKLLRLLQDYYLPYSHITVTANQNIEVELKTGQLVRFSPFKDLSDQVNSLQLILRQATINQFASSQVNQTPRIIDVRFDKPILSF